ncbi:hypothetical protein D3C84_1210300 [compost metagenome]
MEVLPELRMTAADSPALDDFLEALGILGVFHRIDELRHLIGGNIEHEVRVTAEYARENGERIQPRLKP